MEMVLEVFLSACDRKYNMKTLRIQKINLLKGGPAYAPFKMEKHF